MPETFVGDTRTVRSSVLVVPHHKNQDRDVYVLDEETFSIPLTYIDVRRQMRTRVADDTEHTINDQWTEGKDDTLSAD